jgi:hypothetical protein
MPDVNPTVVHPVTVVTSPGQCGASFVMACLRELGRFLGNVTEEDPGSKSSFDNKEVLQLNAEIRGMFSDRDHFPTDPKEVENLVKMFAVRMADAIKGLSVVKGSLFCFTLPIWIAAGLVRRVLVLQRKDPDEVVTASRQYDGLATSVESLHRVYGQAMWMLAASPAPMHLIVYPECATVPKETLRLVAFLVSETGRPPEDCGAAIAKVFDKAKVHFHDFV